MKKLSFLLLALSFSFATATVASAKPAPKKPVPVVKRNPIQTFFAKTVVFAKTPIYRSPRFVKFAASFQPKNTPVSPRS
jgi:hypothetical protein